MWVGRLCTICVPRLNLQQEILQLRVLLRAQGWTLLTANANVNETKKETDPVPGFVVEFAEVLLDIKGNKGEEVATV